MDVTVFEIVKLRQERQGIQVNQPDRAVRRRDSCNVREGSPNTNPASPGRRTVLPSAIRLREPLRESEIAWKAERSTPSIPLRHIAPPTLCAEPC
jgi:hypothetical protein